MGAKSKAAANQTDIKSTKTTKPEVAKSESAHEQGAPSKPIIARDKWGCKNDSQAAAINSHIGTNPVTIEQIAKKTGCTIGRVRNHIRFLDSKKLITIAEDGSVKAKSK